MAWRGGLLPDVLCAMESLVKHAEQDRLKTTQERQHRSYEQLLGFRLNSAKQDCPAEKGR